VNVDVYAKNIAHDSISCEFKESHLTLIIKDAEGNEDYKLDVELYGKVSCLLQNLY
jgi:suppressor of G2 allele of SKP1